MCSKDRKGKYQKEKTVAWGGLHDCLRSDQTEVCSNGNFYDPNRGAAWHGESKLLLLLLTGVKLGKPFSLLRACKMGQWYLACRDILSIMQVLLNTGYDYCY